eukprot:524279-Pyramimonas_sp.AAC.1
MRDQIEDLGLRVMRMRCCHFGLKFDRSSRLPSGAYLQVAKTCSPIPVNQWKCTRRVAGKPAERAEAEREPGRHGQGAQRAEWRNKAIASMTARLIDQI